MISIIVPISSLRNVFGSPVFAKTTFRRKRALLCLFPDCLILQPGHWMRVCISGQPFHHPFVLISYEAWDSEATIDIYSRYLSSSKSIFCIPICSLYRTISPNPNYSFCNHAACSYKLQVPKLFTSNCNVDLVCIYVLVEQILCRLAMVKLCELRLRIPFLWYEHSHYYSSLYRADSWASQSLAKWSTPPHFRSIFLAIFAREVNT